MKNNLTYLQLFLKAMLIILVLLLYLWNYVIVVISISHYDSLYYRELNTVTRRMVPITFVLGLIIIDNLTIRVDVKENGLESSSCRKKKIKETIKKISLLTLLFLILFLLMTFFRTENFPLVRLILIAILLINITKNTDFRLETQKKDYKWLRIICQGLCSITFIILVVITLLFPLEFRRFTQVTWTDARWLIIEDYIQSDGLQLVYIPEMDDKPSLTTDTGRRLLRFASREQMLLTIFRPTVESFGNCQYSSITVEDFYEIMHDLGINSLPILLIVGYGEITQIEIDDRMFDILELKLPYITRNSLQNAIWEHAPRRHFVPVVVD